MNPQRWQSERVCQCSALPAGACAGTNRVRHAKSGASDVTAENAGRACGCAVRGEALLVHRLGTRTVVALCANHCRPSVPTRNVRVVEQIFDFVPGHQSVFETLGWSFRLEKELGGQKVDRSVANDIAARTGDS